MLGDRKEEQLTLFKEILFKKLNVREAEHIARKIAVNKVRKAERGFDPEILELEKELTESLGTRVQIEKKEVGGKIVIDFFFNEDVRNFAKRVLTEMEAAKDTEIVSSPQDELSQEASKPAEPGDLEEAEVNPLGRENPEDEDLYNIRNFSL